MFCNATNCPDEPSYLPGHVPEKRIDSTHSSPEIRVGVQRDKIAANLVEVKEGSEPEYTAALTTLDSSVVMRVIKAESQHVFRGRRGSKDFDSWNELRKSQLVRGETFEYKRPICAKELTDEPDMHDTLFNFIPGSCFEVGSALSLLDGPGKAGEIIDGYALQLAGIIEQVYSNSDIGNQTVVYKENEITLKEFFDKKVLQELAPTSDQIGRCLDLSKKDNWFKGEGKEWLIACLSASSQKEGYGYANMLTKIRAISALGAIITELMPSNVSKLAPLLGQSEDVFLERCERIKTQIRHHDFNNPETRARTERKPIVDGKPLGKELDLKLFPASSYGLGFGNVYVEDSFGPDHSEIRDKYRDELQKYGRGGIRRQGQVIENFSRPGILTEYAIQNIPAAFQEAGLPQLLDGKEYRHGTGINRWQLKGSYPRESWAHEMPAAGAHSCATVDILLALNCLSRDSIFGNSEIVKPAGLLISSFMNFGGYHSFVETFPIVQAVAGDHRFVVKVDAGRKKTLYRDFMATAAIYGGEEAGKKVAIFHNAYRRSSPSRRAYRQSLEARSPRVL